MDKFHASNEKIFSNYGKFYDLLYRDKDYISESNYVKNLLTVYGVESGHLLEIGSGTGGHARILSQSGYIVTGIERSAEMVYQAGIIKNCQFIVGEASNFNLKKKFDAVISLFHVLSYITLDEDISNLFSTVNSHLDSGSIFLFDVWYSPSVMYQKPEIRIKRITGDSIDITRIAEPEILENINQVNVKYTFFLQNLESKKINTFTEHHSMRHFSIPEIFLIAKCHGFEVVKVEEFLTGKVPSIYTWGVCFVLQKI